MDAISINGVYVIRNIITVEDILIGIIKIYTPIFTRMDVVTCKIIPARIT